MDDLTNIVFVVDDEEVITLAPEGVIYIRGEEVDDNRKVYEAMLDFLRQSGFLEVTEWDLAEEISIDDI